MINKIELEWSDVHDLVEILAEKVTNNYQGIKYIYGIERGGLIPAVMLSHRLNIPYISEDIRFAKSFDTYSPSEVLIVDDIADSGKTLKKWVEFDDRMFFHTAVLHHKPHTSDITPTIFGQLHGTDDWIVYPWEHPQAETIQDYKLDK